MAGRLFCFFQPMQLANGGWQVILSPDVFFYFTAKGTDYGLLTALFTDKRTMHNHTRELPDQGVTLLFAVASSHQSPDEALAPVPAGLTDAQRAPRVPHALPGAP